VHAARAARAEAAAVGYRLTIPSPAERWLQVDATFTGVEGPLSVHLSRSSPGRYALHDFGANVFGLAAAAGDGRPLAVTMITPNRWEVAEHDGTVRVTYRVYGDRLDGTFLAVDRTHAHVNMPATLVWSPAFELQPATVTVVPPVGTRWRVATQLLPTSDPLVFEAPNLQFLMDSPLEASAFEWRTFQPQLAPGVAGPAPTMAVAVHHTGSSRDVDAFADDLRAIVREEGAVFREYPAYEGGRYTFLADYLPWAIGDGMEHRDSTVLTSSTALAEQMRGHAAAAAHEFFHSWNVERIRPRGLEPFDFDDVNTSGELWLAEGVTSYYEALVMRRAGLSSMDAFLDDMGQDVNEVITTPAHAYRTVADMSRLAPLVDGIRLLDRTNLDNTFVSYYTYGAALGLAFDLAIREKTGGARSLDDFMRAMWIAHGRPGGARPGYVDHPYSAQDVRAILGQVTGDSALAGHLVDEYVDGRSVPDYAALLEPAGILVRKRSPGTGSIGLIRQERAGDRLRIAAPVPPESPAGRAGLAEDDELLAIDARAFGSAATIDEALRGRHPGDRVLLRVRFRGESSPRDVPVRLEQDPNVELVAVERAGGALDARQRAFRAAWLHGD
jgi:predicted metalloprotease with PDZ domain